MSAQATNHVRVKICGVTTREDAEMALALGADALGFNFFPGSRRRLVFDDAVRWIAELPPFVTRVAVLVNAPVEEALRIARDPAFDVVQLHGDEDAAYCAELARNGVRFIKAIRLRDESSLENAGSFSTRDLLLDAHAGAAFGGTGTKIDLRLAAQAARQHAHFRVILAGGLTPKNVAAAVRAVRPFAVDVATGVEGADGRKCHEKVAAFVAAARAA